MKLVVFILSFLAFSCNLQKGVVSEQEEMVKKDSQNNLSLIMHEQQGVYPTNQFLVVRDEKTLASFFAKINRTRKPGLALPTIDFSKNILIIQCNGEIEANVLRALSIEEENKDQVLISDINQTKTDKEVSNANSFSIYSMPHTSKEIIFKGDKK